MVHLIRSLLTNLTNLNSMIAIEATYVEYSAKHYPDPATSLNRPN